MCLFTPLRSQGIVAVATELTLSEAEDDGRALAPNQQYRWQWVMQQEDVWGGVSTNMPPAVGND